MATLFDFGIPQGPKPKRWYVCNIGYSGWTCTETPETKINPLCDTYTNVPEYTPRFLDEYVIMYKFRDRIPVTILSKSQGTSQTKQ